MANNVKSILLAGVGGQGTLLASEVLAEVLMLAGFDVKKSEIHGMSQRGGSVTSHVRCRCCVKAGPSWPMISK